MNQTIDLLTALAAESEACRACALGEKRAMRKGKNVFSDGNPLARVMVVGEGPGENEEETGLPFVGKAGALLDKMLAGIGLDRTSVFIANVVSCRAFEVETTDGRERIKNCPPKPEEVAACSRFLEEKIRIIKPEIILAVGAPAAKALTGDQNFRITKDRGQWRKGPFDTPIMVTFHPSYILRLTHGEEKATKALVWADLKAVRDRLQSSGIPRNEHLEERTNAPKAPVAQQLSLID